MIRIVLYFLALLFLCSCASSSKFSKRDIRSAQKLLGVEFSDQRIDTVYGYLKRNLNGYDSMHQYTVPHETFPAILFDPRPIGFEKPDVEDKLVVTKYDKVELPDDLNEIAFYTIGELAHLIKTKQITSTELTQLYLSRLKKYNGVLQCAITITEELALKQAAQADAEIASGKYKGLLHGIPFGTKDLMSVAGYKTTWGAMPYKDQEIDHTATVIQRLFDQGAVLVAKLTSGALARGDVWFDGVTKNPWDTLQGASGSSAGPGSATSAGLVGFSLGTETLGSITSPSTRNGISGHRPTYGTVSRDGVMSLSWSMDKVGPMCRSAEDCAIVYSVIEGKDPKDVTTSDIGFAYDGNAKVSNFKVAFLNEELVKDTTSVGDNIRAVMKLLKNSGIDPTPIALPKNLPFNAFDIILRSESGAMFDDLVRSGRVDVMVQQGFRSRANSLRQSRFIPAVEYLQANRFRSMLIEQIDDLFREYDVIIAPTFGGRQLLITNLTGHPVVTVPVGFDDKGRPTSITFISNLYEDGVALEFASFFQRITSFHTAHPPLFTD